MPIFHNLKLENAKIFDTVNLDLRSQGLVFIGGDNGAGKSTLLKLLKRTLFGKQTTATKLLYKDPKKPYLAELIFESDQQDMYKLVEAREHATYGTGIKLFKKENDIWENITNKNLAGKRNDREQIINILGFDKYTYDGLIYLAQESDHVLIHGKPTEIKNWISNLFNLGIFDNALDILKMNIKNLLDYEKDYISQNAIKQSLLDTWIEEEYTNTLEKIKARKVSISSFKDKLSKLQEKKRLNFEVNNLKTNLLQLTDKLQKFPLPSDNEKTKETLDQLEKTIFIKNQADILTTKIKQLEHVSFIDQNLIEKKTILLNDAKQQQHKHIKYLELKAKYDKLTIIPKPDLHLTNSQLTEKEMIQLDSEVNTKIKILQKELKELESFGSTCPLCKQEIKEKDNIIKQYKIDITSLIKERKEIASYLNKFNLYKNYLQKKIDLEIQLKELSNYKNSLLSLIESLSIQLPELKSQHTKFVQKETLIKQLEQINPSPIEIEDLQLQKIQLTTRWENYITYSTLKKQKDELEKTIANYDINPWLKEDDISLEQCNIQLSELEYKIGFLESSYQSLTETKNKINSIVIELNKMLPEIEHLNNLRVLEKVIQKTKQDKIKTIIDHISNRLHYYTSILFDKDSRFVVEEKGKGINIYWKKKNKLIPISEASGGEKKRISLSLIFTLQEIIPYICNLLILDEVDLGLDNKGVDNLIELINLKKDTIDTLILISHKPTIKQANFNKKYYIKKIDDTTSEIVG